MEMVKEQKKTVEKKWNDSNHMHNFGRIAQTMHEYMDVYQNSTDSCFYSFVF